MRRAHSETSKLGNALLALIVLSLLGIPGCAVSQPRHGQHSSMGPTYAPRVNWHTLAEGSRIARAQGKPMVVDFAVPEGCARCDYLEENVYNRQQIVDRLNTDFVPIWVDLNSDLTPAEKALGEKFNYREDCLLLFCDSEGRVISDPDGRKLCFPDQVEPEAFLEYLEYVRTKYRP